MIHFREFSRTQPKLLSMFIMKLQILSAKWDKICEVRNSFIKFPLRSISRRKRSKNFITHYKTGIDVIKSRSSPRFGMISSLQLRRRIIRESGEIFFCELGSFLNFLWTDRFNLQWNYSHVLRDLTVYCSQREYL